MSSTPLRRYETYLFRSKSSSDDAQVPLEGATLAVTRQGATLREEATVWEQDTTTLEVHDIGLLRVGDDLFASLDDAVDLEVISIAADRRSLVVFNNGGVAHLGAGDRLRPIFNNPVLYKDPRGTLALNTPAVDALGYVWFFADEPFVDFTVIGGGLGSPRLYIDKPAGWQRDGETWRNVNDYTSIQAAIDSLPSAGGTVFIPAGTYQLTETLYTPCDRPVHLLGEGTRVQGDKGTILEWTTNTGMIRMRGDGFSLRGLIAKNTAGAVAAHEHEGYGIFIGRRAIVDAHPHPGTSTTQTEHEKFGKSPMKTMRIEDVHVIGSNGWGITIPGHVKNSQGGPEHGLSAPAAGDGGTLAFWVNLNRVLVSSPKKYGGIFTGGGCTLIWCNDGAMLNAHDAIQRDAGGAVIEPIPDYAYARGTVKAEFNRVTFEGNSLAGLDEPNQPIGVPPAEANIRPWVKLVGCENILLESCWFENDPHWSPIGESLDYWPTYFIQLADQNRSIHIRAPHFVRGGKNRGRLRCLMCESGGVKGLDLQMPYAISVTTLSTKNQDNKDVIIDQHAIVLDRMAGEPNRGVVVTGAGLAWDAAETLGNDDLGRLHPLWIAGIPALASMTSEVSIRIPMSAPPDRDGVVDEIYAPLTRVDGSLTTETLTFGQSVGDEVSSLAYWSGGRNPGWRLVNNVPSMSPGELSARSWVDGDLVIDTNSPRLLIRYAGAWQLVKEF